MRTGAKTPRGMKHDLSTRKSEKDHDRGIKRQIGIIRKIDSRSTGTMYVYVDVPDGKDGVRPFGQDKTPVIIIDNPVDILVRWGAVEIGQVVEIFYRGIGESGSASAHIIGATPDDFKRAVAPPIEGFNTASSLPFEPMGLF